MNGLELAAEIRRTRPEIAILVTSGFPGNLLPGAQQHGSFEMLPKPFTQADLAAALAKVCAEPRGRPSSSTMTEA
jgi:CheY-like chemotaxis protein